MEIQEQGELLLHRQLASEEFKIGRERAIDLVGEILREWSFREQSLTGRMPLQAVEGRVKSPDSIVEKLKKNFMICQGFGPYAAIWTMCTG